MKYAFFKKKTPLKFKAQWLGFRIKILNHTLICITLYYLSTSVLMRED